MIVRHAPGGGVAAAHHLAAAAGVAMLDRGGCAVDAGVAAGAVMAVTSPHLCGLGGDLFALVLTPGEPPLALNASGRAGSGADAQALRDEGRVRMPFGGDVRAVTVPGAVDGLLALADRGARLPLADLLAPARRLAETGFPASASLAAAANALPGEVRAVGFGARSPIEVGQRLTVPGVARALTAIGHEGRAGFYAGEAGDELRALGRGLFDAADLAVAHANWVAPLALDAFAATLWTVPPNSQGYLALSSAWIAQAAGVPEDPDDGEWAHVLVEAARQAAYDRSAVLHEHADPAPLVDPVRLTARAREIGERAATGLHDAYRDGDTTYLCAVDADRMGVSLIMSNAAGFGSGLVLPRSGIFLHNRGIGFSLRDGHVAEYGPGRRPPSTLSPAAVTGPGGGPLRAVLGTMGGDAQPQIVLQLLARTLLAGEDPERAITAPRWSLAHDPSTGFDTWEGGRTPLVALEAGAPAAWARTLRARGHDVRVDAPNVGHAQMITVDEGTGMLCGAADPRAGDGAFAGR